MAIEREPGLHYQCDSPYCEVEEFFPEHDRVGRPKLAGWVEGADGKVYHSKECQAHGDADEEESHVLDEVIRAINAYKPGCDNRFIDHATERSGDYFSVVAEGTEREYKVTISRYPDLDY